MRILLSIICAFLISCNQAPLLPKPKAQLSLVYPAPDYQRVEHSCPYAFEMNQYASFEGLKHCESKVVYTKMRATLYLSYRPVKGNLDSLLADAYQMPSKHIIKATEIPERVFINPDKRVYGTLFRIVGEAASQAQFFLTDSVDNFLVGSLYFYTRPNYDSILPAARYIERDMVRIMESLEWDD